MFTCLLYHGREVAILHLCQEDIWFVKLNQTSRVQDNNTIHVNNGIEPMSDSQNSAVVELCSNGFLNESICFQVYIGRCLIQDENFVSLEERTGKAEQLS